MDERALYESRLELVDFLLRALADVPERSFVERLVAGDLETPDGEVNESLDHGFGELEAFVVETGDDPASVHDALEREYSRLFVGPRPPILAHETSYREDTEFVGEGLADVEASYAAAGWSPPEESDFVTVELAFLRHLIDRQRTGDEAAVGFERVFLDEHALQWAEPFATDLRERADSRFYRAVASVYRGTLAFEDEPVDKLG
jgi:TorA maturation chaperone TorD